MASQNPASRLSPSHPPHSRPPHHPHIDAHSPNPPVDEEQKQLEEQQKAAREQQIAILQQFVDSGGKDRLKAVLRERLQEAGWKEGVKELCKEVMRNNRIEGVTVDELVGSTTARARGAWRVGAWRVGVGAEWEGCGVERRRMACSIARICIYTNTRTLTATMPDDIRLEALKAIRDSLQTDLG